MSRPVSEWIMDGAALGVLGGVLAKVLPAAAALLACVWYCVLLWECKTGQAWRARWRRLFQRSMTIADRVAYFVLALFSIAAAFVIYGIGRILGL